MLQVLKFEINDSVNNGKSSQLGKHGFGSLHNFTWTYYYNEDILLRHCLPLTNEIVWTSLTLRMLTQNIISAPNAQFRNFGNFPNHREVPVTKILELIFTVKSQHFVITNLYTLFSKYKSIIVCTFLWLSLDF